MPEYLPITNLTMPRYFNTINHQLVSLIISAAHILARLESFKPIFLVFSCIDNVNYNGRAIKTIFPHFNTKLFH